MICLFCYAQTDSKLHDACSECGIPFSEEREVTITSAEIVDAMERTRVRRYSNIVAAFTEIGISISKKRVNAEVYAIKVGDLKRAWHWCNDHYEPPQVEAGRLEKAGGVAMKVVGKVAPFLGKVIVKTIFGVARD